MEQEQEVKSGVEGSDSEQALDRLKEDIEQYNAVHNEEQDTLKLIGVNTQLLWMTATMATIAAINTLLNSVLYKWLVFLGIGIVSSILHKNILLYGAIFKPRK